MKTRPYAACFGAVAVLFAAQAGWAMSAAQHEAPYSRMLEIPPERGGALGLSREQAQSVRRWMDHPATRPGQFRNRVSDSPVSPSNHGHLRHNPEAVARAMSGTGQTHPAILNIARLHKIQDIAHNSAPVDGWAITPHMRRDAGRILRHVEKHGSLPQRLPAWVDQSGPAVTAARPRPVAPRKPKAGAARAAARSKAGAVSRIAGRAAFGVGVIVEGCVRGKSSYGIEQEYQAGAITEDERNMQHAENAGGALGGLSGAWALAKGGAAGGFLVGGPWGALICGVGGGLVGGFGGDYLGSRLGRWLGERK